jgi:hypothetical protein
MKSPAWRPAHLREGFATVVRGARILRRADVCAT